MMAHCTGSIPPALGDLNWTLSDAANRVTVLVGVAYESDADQVTRVLQEIVEVEPAVAGEHSGGLLAGRVHLAGEAGPEPRRGDRHPGARGGAPRGVELGEVGGQGRVIELLAAEPGVELAEGAGVGAAGVGADRRAVQ